MRSSREDLCLNRSHNPASEPPELDFTVYEWVSEWKTLSCVQLFATSWAIQFTEFSRLECWSGQTLPSPGDLPNLGIEPRTPALWVGSFEPRESPSLSILLVHILNLYFLLHLVKLESDKTMKFCKPAVHLCLWILFKHLWRWLICAVYKMKLKASNHPKAEARLPPTLTHRNTKKQLVIFNGFIFSCLE